MPHLNSTLCKKKILSGHPILGDIPALRLDPLRFLLEFTEGDTDIVPIRIPFVPTFLLLNPADIERVLVADHQDFGKPLWLRTPAVRRLLGDGLVTSDGEAWRRQRRSCQPAFHPGLIPVYGEKMVSLTERMLAGWQSGQLRPLQRDLAQLTVEVVTSILLGADSGGAPSAQISETMDTLMRCFSGGHSFFGLAPLPSTPREAIAIRRLDRLTDRLIALGAATDEPQTLLTMLINEQAQGAGTEGRRALREQVKTFLAAGHESSALALTWAFLMLARHPAAEAKLALELRNVLGNHAPTPSDLANLPYTQAVMKETLRLYPPLWMTGRKALRRCEIGGQNIPTGSLLLTSPWVLQRHPRYFSNPNEFRPERWENAETVDLPRFAYFPFGGGPRICIGQGFAMMETGLILATIAQRFQLEQTSDSDLAPWATMTLRPPEGITMIARER